VLGMACSNQTTGG